MALIVAVHLPVMMTVSAVLIERALTRDGIATGHATAAVMARSVAKNLAINPIIIGLAVGIVWRIFSLPLGGLPATLVDRLADVGSTGALIALVMRLRKFGIVRNIPD